MHYRRGSRRRRNRSSSPRHANRRRSSRSRSRERSSRQETDERGKRRGTDGSRGRGRDREPRRDGEYAAGGGRGDNRRGGGARKSTMRCRDYDCTSFPVLSCQPISTPDHSLFLTFLLHPAPRHLVDFIQSGASAPRANRARTSTPRPTACLAMSCPSTAARLAGGLRQGAAHRSAGRVGPVWLALAAACCLGGPPLPWGR